MFDKPGVAGALIQKAFLLSLKFIGRSLFNSPDPVRRLRSKSFEDGSLSCSFQFWNNQEFGSVVTVVIIHKLSDWVILCENWLYRAMAPSWTGREGSATNGANPSSSESTYKKHLLNPSDLNILLWDQAGGWNTLLKLTYNMESMQCAMAWPLS